ncbi:MAG: WYL domain-containing protein [Muribaculaceae bacterium]|nr:WYL domain-containing protein [Muribaculaceae bacterium]
MSKNLFNRYIWIIDTIRRRRTITRSELDRLWMRTSFSEGKPIPRRTFYNYRNAIETIFGVNIQCNPSTFEYYIEEDEAEQSNVTDWMLNTTAMSNTLSEARDISSRIFLEDVPSARQFLSPVITAMREYKQIDFAYMPYTRSGRPSRVRLEPYFLKIFRQRWYITGRNIRENMVKTYALDRMTEVRITTESFEMPADFDAADYSRHSFGIVFSHGEPRKVTLRVDPRQAKYFRALPLHHSQSEMVTDGYSIFTYYLRLTPDFVQELLSYGPRVTVVGPPELRAMMIQNLKESLDNYSS